MAARLRWKRCVVSEHASLQSCRCLIAAFQSVRGLVALLRQSALTLIALYGRGGSYHFCAGAAWAAPEEP